MSLISKVLVANRGEIACRIMRTARRLGVQTVAVYSEADKASRHVAMADEAHLLGPAPSAQSYLRQDRILDIAKKSGSEAIHPGYGFLSENVEFADLCQKRGLIFVGPPSEAIRDMGIKSTSKIIMSEANVPIIGGYHGEDQSNDCLAAEAEKIGFPVMIKAVRGGGGKGMRIALNKGEFEDQLESARTEAMKSFGDQVMLIEKYVETPRHIEVQIFGDSHGNYVYLFERDCSVQRRHQKVIEEAPGPGVSWEVRKKLGEAAVRAAKAVNYVGAGTVEFIMDKNFDFYFMEMNTRLQVEHPITEMITGTDLVEWQLRAASGHKLPVTQQDLNLDGWAFEARIYAEDPESNFMPGAGPLNHLSTPQASESIRIETGVREGDEVSVHYDPMIAKLVVWGPDRDSALLKLRNSLSEYNIEGLPTNVNFLMNLASHKEFKAGNVDTDFISRHYDDLFPKIKPTNEDICAAVLTCISENDEKGASKFERINHDFIANIELENQDSQFKARISSSDGKMFKVAFRDTVLELSRSSNMEEPSQTEMSFFLDGVKHKRRVVTHGEAINIFGPNGCLTFTRRVPTFLSNKLKGGDRGLGDAVAPMPGVVEKILVTPGTNVNVGDPLIVMIAMKMEYVIKAPKDGVVEAINHTVGEFVAKDTLLVQLVEE